MKKIFLGILVTSFLFLGLSEVLAQRGNRNRLQKKERIVKLLKLTDNQLEKFQEIRFAHQEKMIDLQANLKKNKLAVKRYVNGSDVTKSELIALTDKASNLHSTIKNSKINMWFNVYNILDNEQKVLWKKHFIRMGMKHKKMGMQGKPMRRGNCK